MEQHYLSGKFFDPEFYKQRNPDQDPYKFLEMGAIQSDEDQPLTHAWGGFVNLLLIRRWFCWSW